MGLGMMFLSSLANDIDRRQRMTPRQKAMAQLAKEAKIERGRLQNERWRPYLPVIALLWLVLLAVMWLASPTAPHWPSPEEYASCMELYTEAGYPHSGEIQCAKQIR